MRFPPPPSDPKPPANPPLPPEGICLAKTRKTENGIEKGCDLFTHLVSTARIIEALDSLYKKTPRESLFQSQGKSLHWLAALHDLGKATPSFQNKIYKAIDTHFKLGSGEYFYSDMSHASFSRLLLKGKDELFSKLAGAHHGVFPTHVGGCLLRY